MPTLLALVPHPDDESYSFAGTIAAAGRAAWRCMVECASRGEGGKRATRGLPGRRALGRARLRELRASCDLLGAELRGCWSLPDGRLRECPSQAGRIIATLGATRPDLVLALGPDGAYGHPDHLAFWGWLADAWRAMSAPPPLLLAAFPPGLFAPQWERCRAMMGDPPQPPVESLGGGPRHYRLRLAGLSAVKRRAIACHRTQLPGGKSEALLPPGVVEALLDEEAFTDARSEADPSLVAVFAALQKAALTAPGG